MIYLKAVILLYLFMCVVKASSIDKPTLKKSLLWWKVL